MTKMNSRLVFFGNERLATGISASGSMLSGLIEAGYDIAALVLNQHSVNSRISRDPEVISIAQKHKIPLIEFTSGNDMVEKLANLEAQAGILVAFGQIIPQKLIDTFPSGIINLHPSLLPLYRGSTPLEQVILDGQTKTGVSLMQLVQKMDAGPVFAQKQIAISNKISKQELAEKLLDLGQDLLIKNLPNILSGALKPVSQNEKLATYTSLINKTSGKLNLTKSAVQLEREVRAYLGWPKSQLELYGHNIIVTNARVVGAEDPGALILQCQPGWLEILELIAPSGRKMSGQDFIRGYKK